MVKSVKKIILSLVQSTVVGVLEGVLLGSTRIVPSFRVVLLEEVPLTKEMVTYC